MTSRSRNPSRNFRRGGTFQDQDDLSISNHFAHRNPGRRNVQSSNRRYGTQRRPSNRLSGPPNRRPSGKPRPNARRLTMHNINRNGNNKIGSRKYCSLCGGTSHSAVDICFKMRTPKGDNVLVAPSAQPCTYCKSHFNTELFHPEPYCWRKNQKSSRKQ